MSSNLILLASALAIDISKDLSVDELDTLSAFFTAFADNLALASIQKSKSDS